MKKKKLYVIAVISNPVRYASRYELFQQFERRMREAGAHLFVTEVAFGHRHFEVTETGNPHHLQLRSDFEMWHKENMINLAIQRLPSDWEYVAWIDADVEFMRKDWINETIQQLQHFQVVQLFEDAIDMGPKHQVIQSHKGFVHMYRSGAKRGKNYTFWHPGFAWAARRGAIDSLGGLIDFAVLGAADHHMALAMIGEAKDSVPGQISKAYLEDIMSWQTRAERHIKRDIGFVPGTLLHHWHGKKKDRKYVERWSIITKNKFDPRTDLKHDWQGLYELEIYEPRQIIMRDEIRAYFRSRSEDSIDVE